MYQALPFKELNLTNAAYGNHPLT